MNHYCKKETKLQYWVASKAITYVLMNKWHITMQNSPVISDRMYSVNINMAGRQKPRKTKEELPWVGIRTHKRVLFSTELPEEVKFNIYDSTKKADDSQLRQT